MGAADQVAAAAQADHLAAVVALGGRADVGLPDKAAELRAGGRGQAQQQQEDEDQVFHNLKNGYRRLNVASVK